MKKVSLSRVFLLVNTELSPHILKTLSECGIKQFYSLRGREQMLKERSWFLGLFTSISQFTEGAELFRFYVPRESEIAITSHLTQVLNIRQRGGVTLFAEDAEIIANEDALFFNSSLEIPERGVKLKPFIHRSITCVVNRGTGDAIAKRTLEMGQCVPAIFLGKGLGLRNKLGLVRITIPAEKEICSFIVPPEESHNLTAAISAEGQLHIPGQGIIFETQVRVYAQNKRIFVDKMRHLATMDQIISVIDDVIGSTEWRLKSENVSDYPEDSKNRCLNLTLFANDGTLSEAVMQAMAVGAGGATQSLLTKHENSSNRGIRSYLSSEMCDILIPLRLLDPILKKMEEIDFLSPPFDGHIEISDIEKICTNQSRR